jgi:hypothetical protein
MRGEAVSATVPPEVNLETYEIVVMGDVGPTVLGGLGGFRVTRAESGRTHLVGQVDDPVMLYDLLELLGQADLPIVSLNPAEDALGA